jgi:hypothetical protein
MAKCRLEGGGNELPQSGRVVYGKECGYESKKWGLYSKQSVIVFLCFTLFWACFLLSQVLLISS